MELPSSPRLKTKLVVLSLVSLVILSVAAWVQIASAALTFTGNQITGDSSSVIDATGTISIGASSATGITVGRSGITANFPGTVTITGTTTTLQNLVISGNCTGSGCLVPGGDLSGSASSQTVTGIQGRAVSSTAPSANQVLMWNGSFWTPANVSSSGSGITAINGLSNGTTSIVGAGTVTVSTSSPNVITITGTGSGAITINSLTTSTFSIQGTANQISVATTSPNILTLSLPQNIGTSNAPTFGGLTVNGNATATNLTISGISGSTQCLHVNANGVVTGTGADCGAGGGGVTLLNNLSGAVIATGTANQIFVSSSTGSLVFSLPQNIAAASTPAFAGLSITGNSTNAGPAVFQSSLTQSGGLVSLASTTITGNATTTGNLVVLGVLMDASGNHYVTSTSGGTTPTIDGITSSTFTFVASGTGLAVASSASPNTITYTWTNPGYVLTSGNNTWTGAQTFNATATFLGPIVESSTGAGSVQLAEGTCPSGSSGNDILCANSSHAFESSLNGGSFVAIPQLAGDLGNTAAAPKVVGLQGVAVSSTAPSSNQCLIYNGTTWAPGSCGSGGSGSVTTSSAITANTFPFWANTTGGLSGTSTLSISGNTITNSGNAQIGGTLNVTSTATFNATTTFLGAIQGGSPSSTEGMQIMEGNCPSAVSGSDILCASSSTHSFQISLNGGSYFSIPELTGDLDNSASSPTVVGLQGRAVSSTAPSANQVLTWTGSVWAPENASGTGGGGITAINGLSNSTTSIAAGTGISISTSSPNIITITATGGGASSSWSGMTNPTANLSLSMGDYTTALTYGTTTTVTPFLIQDTTGNTATSSLFQVSTVGTSVASPVKFTAQGTANGVQMNSSGTLNAIGTGNINATQIQGIGVSTTTPGTNQVLTYNGSVWAPANASGTGGGSGALSTSSAITSGTFPFWTGANGALSGTSTVSVSGNTITNSGNTSIGGTLNVTSTASLQATTTILGNVAFGTSTTNSGANMFASYGTTGTTTLMLGATSTARTGCIELVSDGGATVYYLTISSAGALQISSSTCL
jgi:hypothetical protein